MIFDERQIVKRIKNSDREAFKVLYDEFANRIYKFLCRKLNNSEEAADLVQEVFVKVWNNREKLDSSQSIKSYLFTSANNIAIDFFRKKKLEVADVEDYENRCIYEFEQDFDIPDHIKKAVDQLPVMQKNVFYLSRFEGLKHEEISQLLKISKRTVENHMWRALSKLRENLKHLIIFLCYILIRCIF
ncbi:MAG: RNA polymerase sigma factor [Rhodothermaceae bacterium]